MRATNESHTVLKKKKKKNATYKGDMVLQKGVRPAYQYGYPR